MNAIPILLYHGITDSPSDGTAPYAVKPDDFARHMDLIAERGFRCLTVSHLIDELRSPNTELRSPNSTRSEKTVVVTFDDGYADFAVHALPILQARKIPSTLYVTTGWLQGGTTERLTKPSDAFLDWSQIPELTEAGVEIGSHSHSHPHMDTLDTAAAVYELTRSKALIEDSMAKSIRSFAYPHGYNSPRIRRLTAEAGYDSAVGVRNMLSHRNDNDFRLARLMLMNTTTVDQVAAWLDGTNAPMATPSDSPKTIGWRVYRRAKALAGRKPGTDYA